MSAPDAQTTAKSQRVPEQTAKGDEELVREGDFYMEGPYVVFTAAYHLRRGYCCNSECRHCPYK